MTSDLVCTEIVNQRSFSSRYLVHSSCLLGRSSVRVRNRCSRASSTSSSFSCMSCFFDLSDPKQKTCAGKSIPEGYTCVEAEEEQTFWFREHRQPLYLVYHAPENVCPNLFGITIRNEPYSSIRFQASYENFLYVHLQDESYHCLGLLKPPLKEFGILKQELVLLGLPCLSTVRGHVPSTSN